MQMPLFMVKCLRSIFNCSGTRIYYCKIQFPTRSIDALLFILTSLNFRAKNGRNASNVVSEEFKSLELMFATSVIAT